jgi:predicted DNA repair protein MutK
MSGGLVALLDDVAALARLAAASADDVAGAAGRASTKAAGVVIDDTAVTPRYVQGFRPERELPVIRRIAIGSLRNKLLVVVPALLVLDLLIPWILTPLLMIGGAYLCYEGAERVWERFGGHHDEARLPAAVGGAEQEDRMVSGAIRTDFILSAEIMVLSLNEVADEGFWSLVVILLVVAVAITVLVYGVVALIVKMDDIGLHLARTGDAPAAPVGRGLVRAMPVVLTVLTVVGVAAMLWVGGHILLVGFDDLGWTLPYDLVHDVEVAVADAAGPLGGVAGWLTNTLASAVVGLVVGAAVVAVMHVIPRRGGDDAAAAH